MFYSLIRPFLFQLNPELIHNQVMYLARLSAVLPGILQSMAKFTQLEDPSLNVKIKDLTFPNPIGLAAGFDKNAEAIPFLQALGFGHLELGTVTPLAQPGNPKPRIFRLVKDQALINRMGFNNHGIDHLLDKLSSVKRNIPLGINIGKNKITPITEAANDYVTCLEKAWCYADYFTLNISSPNTPDLRSLQQEKLLDDLLEKIASTKEKLVQKYGINRQIWLKVAPDLNEDEITSIIKAVNLYQIDALVLTNTTNSRENLVSSYRSEIGGLSGKPLKKLSNQVLKAFHNASDGKIPIIATGGIFNAEDVKEKMELGATMVQIYTGFIYQGPFIVKTIKRELIKMYQKNKST